MDRNNPVTNPYLKECMQALKQDNSEENQNRVLQEIAMQAHFLSLVVFSQPPKDNGDGTATFEKESTMQFPLLTTADGSILCPAFTDWEELNKWRREETPRTLVLTFDDYASMVLRDTHLTGLVINPFGENLVLDRALLTHMQAHKAQILAGVQEQKIDKETQVLLGEPAERPEAALAAMAAIFRENLDVCAAWLRLLRRDDTESYLIVVDCDGDARAVFVQAAAAARPHLQGMPLDFVPYSADFGRHAAQGVEPFFSRD